MCVIFQQHEGASYMIQQSSKKLWFSCKLQERVLTCGRVFRIWNAHYRFTAANHSSSSSPINTPNHFTTQISLPPAKTAIAAGKSFNKPGFRSPRHLSSIQNCEINPRTQKVYKSQFFLAFYRINFVQYAYDCPHSLFLFHLFFTKILYV